MAKTLIEYKEKKPRCHDGAYVDASTKIIGDVIIGEHSTVWYNTILRGEEGDIIIDPRVNILDKVLIEAPKGKPVIIKEGALICHGAIIRGARIGRNTFVGIGAIILDGADVGDNCVVSAGSLVAKGERVPNGKVCEGIPAKVSRDVTEDEKNELRDENASILERAADLLMKVSDVVACYSEGGQATEITEIESIIDAPRPKKYKLTKEELAAMGPGKVEDKIELKKKVKFKEIRFDDS